MQKLSPLMKGLVETRARADAQCLRLSHLIEHLTSQLAKSTSERNSCDQLITSLNSQIQPGQIEPINAWQGRYGKRGTLKAIILQALREAYPSELSTTHIAALLQHLFALEFQTPAQRKAWVRDTINNRLQALVHANLIHRTHDPKANTGRPGTWQWIPPGQAFSNLQTLSGQAGIHTTCALDQDYLELEPAPEEDDLPR